MNFSTWLVATDTLTFETSHHAPSEQGGVVSERVKRTGFSLMACMTE